MKITLASVYVDDQEKALKFYTDILGFVKKTEIPAGKFRWLTVVSPEGPDDIELVLEPDENPAAKTFKKALVDQGNPVYGICRRRYSERVRTPEEAGRRVQARADTSGPRDDRDLRRHLR